MKRRKTPHCEVKKILERQGVDFRKNFYVLPSSDVSLIVEGARKAGYRKRRDAPGSTGRMYFQLLQRKDC